MAATDGVIGAGGQMVGCPPGDAEEAAEREQGPELVEQRPPLAEACGLPRTERDSEDDVGRADRDGEQQQRLERLGDGRYCQTAQSPMSRSPRSPRNSP